MSVPVATTAETLPSLVKEAAAVLSRATSAAEVLAAQDMASTIYDAAKRAARLQKAKRAHDELINATYRVQADSLEIESLAKSRLAKEYDEARPESAAKGGRPKTVPDGNGFTAEEAGLTRKQVFEARQMRDAIEHDPGIVRRALDQMLLDRVEPTRAALKRELPRANLRAAVGTSSASKEDRGNNLYETPIEAVRALLALESFLPQIWEPSVGRGAILRPLEDAGYDVAISDLVDYGTTTRHGEVQGVVDFHNTRPPDHDFDLVTNPPYGSVMNAYIAHALRVCRPRKMALLLNLNVLAGFDDPDRNFYMDECPPARIYVFTRRLPMMHRDGWDGPEASSRMNTAWFVWERDDAGSYGRRTIIDRVDWKAFEEASALPPQLPQEHARVGALLDWRDNGEGLHEAYIGEVKFGAVRVDPKTRKVRWARFLNCAVPGGFWDKAKSFDVARDALEQDLLAFLSSAGLSRAEAAECVLPPASCVVQPESSS